MDEITKIKGQSKALQYFLASVVIMSISAALIGTSQLALAGPASSDHPYTLLIKNLAGIEEALARRAFTGTREAPAESR